MTKKECGAKNCRNPVWGGGYCKTHQYLREDIAGIKRENVKFRKYKRLKSKKKPTEQIEKEREDRHEMYMLFLSLWKARGSYSEVSNTKIYGEPMSSYFHHILPKSKYPDLRLDPDNIIILTAEEHDQVEKDSTKFEEINKRRDILLEKILSSKNESIQTDVREESR